MAPPPPPLRHSSFSSAPIIKLKSPHPEYSISWLRYVRKMRKHLVDIKEPREHGASSVNDSHPAPVKEFDVDGSSGAPIRFFHSWMSSPEIPLSRHVCRLWAPQTLSGVTFKSHPVLSAAQHWAPFWCCVQILGRWGRFVDVAGYGLNVIPDRGRCHPHWRPGNTRGRLHRNWLAYFVEMRKSKL